jgi:hypothetical protein
MGIQTLVVVIGVASALGVGVLTAASGMSLRSAGLIAVGLAPLMWAVTYVIERIIGRDIWDYAAPYPYRWMDVTPTDEKPAVTTEADNGERHDDRYSLKAA